MPGADRHATSHYDVLIEGERIEAPLHPKRKRMWSPPQPTRSSSTTETPILMPETSTVSSASAAPSPVLFQEIGLLSAATSPMVITERRIPTPLRDHLYNLPSGSSTPTTSRINWPLARKSALKDREISNLLELASDEEENEEDDFVINSNIFFTGRQVPFDGTYEEDEVPPVQSVESLPEVTREISESDQIFPVDKFDFKWVPFPTVPVSTSLRRETFTQVSGPLESYEAPYDAFVAIWDTPLMEYIVAQTNKHAQFFCEERMEKGDLQLRSRIQDWKDTTVDEMFVYFALIMGMAFCYKAQLKEYWTSTGSLTDTPNFANYMSYSRFLLLSRCLHFADTAELHDLVSRNQLTLSEVKIKKIQPIIDHLNSRFQRLYNLSQNIVIDESLVQWKGWLSIKQFIKNKAAAVGIKTFDLCDSKNGYLWRFELYTGSDNAPAVPNQLPLDGKIPKLVLRILEGFEYSGRTVWMDNFYNSPALARHLKSVGLDCAGTLRTNRQLVPDSLKYLEKSKMRVGEIAGCTSGDVDIMVWRDKNRVSMISTYHGIAVSTAESKPVVVLDYNVRMGGVDRKDQLLSQYPMERKRTTVWYKKFFRRLLNVSITNAYILMNDTQSKIQHRNFRKSLMDALLAKHFKPRSLLEPPREKTLMGIGQVMNQVPIFDRAYISHFPQQYPVYPGQKGERQRKRCHICKKRTPTFCPGCNKPLCVFTENENCFIKFHS